MKKFILVGAVLVVFGINIMGAFSISISADEEGKLECADIVGCNPGAKCNGPGTPDNCNIVCQSGDFIVCGRPLDD